MQFLGDKSEQDKARGQQAERHDAKPPVRPSERNRVAAHGAGNLGEIAGDTVKAGIGKAFADPLRQRVDRRDDLVRVERHQHGRDPS